MVYIKLLVSFIESVSFYVPTTGFIYEWEHDIEESVDKLFNGCPIDYSHAFQVHFPSPSPLELFLPFSSLH